MNCLNLYACRQTAVNKPRPQCDTDTANRVTYVTWQLAVVSVGLGGPTDDRPCVRHVTDCTSRWQYNRYRGGGGDTGGEEGCLAHASLYRECAAATAGYHRRVCHSLAQSAAHTTRVICIRASHDTESLTYTQKRPVASLITDADRLRSGLSVCSSVCLSAA